MSQTGASLLLVVSMIALAIYLFFAPPPGFSDNFVYRIALPFVLISSAFSVLENLRTRTHLGQLVGAIRGLMGKRGVEATPEIKAEAVEILLKSMRSDEASVRKTAAVQLRNLTGQGFGEDAGAWESWWAQNKDTFGKDPSA